MRRGSFGCRTLGASHELVAGAVMVDRPGQEYMATHEHHACGDAHVALRAASRAAVDRFHAAGLKAGAKDNGAPGLRTDYAPDYYAAFLLDADGNNVEAVCMR